HLERFPDDVFHLAHLETADLDPLRQLSARFSQAYRPDSPAAFFHICHVILVSGLFSSSRRLSLFFPWSNVLSDYFGSLLRSKKMAAHILSASSIARSSRGARYFVRSIGS